MRYILLKKFDEDSIEIGETFTSFDDSFIQTDRYGKVPEKFLVDQGYIKPLPEDIVYTTYLHKEERSLDEELREEGVEGVGKYAFSEMKVCFKIKDGKEVLVGVEYDGVTLGEV